MKQFYEIKSRANAALAPMLDKGLDRWDAFTNREQLIVSVLALVMLLAFFVLVILLPLQKQRDFALMQYQSHSELLGWMASVTPQAKGLSGSGELGQQSAQSMMNTVNQGAQSHQLRLDRIQPEGRNKLRVWMQDVSYDATLRWLADLQENSGIVVTSITIDGGRQEGVVTVRVVLAGGAG